MSDDGGARGGGSQDVFSAERWPAPPRDHRVHFYWDDGALVRTLARFVADGLEAGDALLLAATEEHLALLDDALSDLGVDAADARREGRLVVLGTAEAVAERVAGDPRLCGRVTAQAADVIAAAARAAPSGRVRAFGEVADVLWRRGERRVALTLEQAWHETVRCSGTPVTCGYRLESFGEAGAGEDLRDVCAVHGAVVPAARQGWRWEDEHAPSALLEEAAAELARDLRRRRQADAARERQRAQERALHAENALLYRLTDSAVRAGTPGQAYQAALDGIAAALGVDRASILLLDAAGVMRFVAWRGLSDAYRAAVEGHSPWPADARDPAPVLVEDARRDPGLARLAGVLEREGIGALGFFPLVEGERLIGKFMVYHRGPHVFADAEVRLAGLVARQIALVVERWMAQQERERFLGILGHDLRNPLNAIAASAGALQRHAPPALVPAARRIAGAAARMDRMIDQLLGFVRARQGGGVPVRRATGDLAAVARGVVDELRAAHPDRAIGVAAGEATGAFDADRMAEVLSNLVGNALQHGTGDVEVAVGVEGAELVARVHNQGAPIPTALLPSLFDPFRRGKAIDRSAVDAADRNLGLGLYISREIVRAHGGTIEVASVAAEGTTFTVRLPRGEAA